MLETAPGIRTSPAATAGAKLRALRWPDRAGAGRVLLLIIAWFGATSGFRPLTLPDEGRYVGVAWEMLRSGHWAVPTLDGLPFFHKPPLFYWMAAASMRRLRSQRMGGPVALADRRERRRVGAVSVRSSAEAARADCELVARPRDRAQRRLAHGNLRRCAVRPGAVQTRHDMDPRRCEFDREVSVARSGGRSRTHAQIDRVALEPGRPRRRRERQGLRPTGACPSIAFPDPRPNGLRPVAAAAGCR